MDPAPYRADLAQAPEGAQAVWVRADDGVRLRLALHRLGDRGTVLIFPGRTEWVEKYGPLVGDLAAAGYSALVIDWRGQGLSDRLLDDPLKGHVADFPDYQMDVQAALDAARDAELPQPYFLIAHSMGGAIGLRAVMQDLPVRGAVFSGPLWGVKFPVWARPVAGMLGTLSRWTGLGDGYAPSTSADPYILTADFEDNLLTTDRAAFAQMGAHMRAEPGFGLAGPTMTWVHEANCECKYLATLPSPALPCLTLLGSNERIVDVGVIHERMARWPGGELVLVEGGEHEVLMESPDKRAPLIARMVAFCDAHRGAAD